MSTRKSVCCLVILCVLLLMLAGCQPSVESSKPVPPQAGAPAWQFTLTDLAGNKHALRSLRGKKVLVNFWATWCGPCRDEMPLMVRVYDELRGQKFEIVAVNVGEGAARVAQFAQDYEINFPVLLDEHSIVARAYFLRGIPTSIFVDEQGIIRAVHIGTLTERLLRQYIAGTNP